jgi:hypothetical protein
MMALELAHEIDARHVRKLQVDEKDVERKMPSWRNYT